MYTTVVTQDDIDSYFLLGHKINNNNTVFNVKSIESRRLEEVRTQWKKKKNELLCQRTNVTSTGQTPIGRTSKSVQNFLLS